MVDRCERLPYSRPGGVSLCAGECTAIPLLRRDARRLVIPRRAERVEVRGLLQHPIRVLVLPADRVRARLMRIRVAGRAEQRERHHDRDGGETMIHSGSVSPISG